MTLTEKKAQMSEKLKQAQREMEEIGNQIEVVSKMNPLCTSLDAIADCRVRLARYSGYLAGLEQALEGLE